MSGWAMWNTASPETTNRTCVISFCRCFFVSLLSVSIHFNKNRRPERRITHPTYYQPKQCTIRNASTFIPPKNAYSNFSLPPEITGWPFHLLPRKRANKKTFAEVAATKKTPPQRQVLQTIWKEGPNHSSSHLSFPKFSGPYLVGKFLEENHRQTNPCIASIPSFSTKRATPSFWTSNPDLPKRSPDESFPEPLPYQRVISLWQVQSYVPPLQGVRRYAPAGFWLGGLLWVSIFVSTFTHTEWVG